MDVKGLYFQTEQGTLLYHTTGKCLLLSVIFFLQTLILLSYCCNEKRKSSGQQRRGAVSHCSDVTKWLYFKALSSYNLWKIPTSLRTSMQINKSWLHGSPLSHVRQIFQPCLCLCPSLLAGCSSSLWSLLCSLAGTWNQARDFPGGKSNLTAGKVLFSP